MRSPEFERFTLEPRDGLLVRDGRAMNAHVGRSLALPHPPTIAGLVRTRLGSDARGTFDKARIASLLAHVHIAGPLLARLALDGDRIEEVYGAAPADCVWFGAPKAEVGHRLRPRPASDLVPGATTDLGDGALLCGLGPDAPKTKAALGPLHWDWASLLRWLQGRADTVSRADVVGLDALEREARTHVVVDPITGTAQDGALFATESVRYARRRDREPGQRLALLCGAKYEGPRLGRGLVPLGGERRTAFFSPVGAMGPDLGPPSWLDTVRKGSLARVLLLTPAVFGAGSRPARVAGAPVVASKVGRPEVVSGWSFEHRGPKPTRRMVPAGSVFWVEVPSDSWARDTWLACVGDGEQDRRDGFGLALVGCA